MVNRTNQLFADGDNSATINGAGSNGFTNGYDLVIVFGLMLWWYFSLIIFAFILGKKMMTDLKKLTSQILLSKDSPCKKNHLE